MSEDSRHAELQEKTQHLLNGALKHVRAAALAAALVPLGAVALSPAVPLAHASGGTGGGTPGVPMPCDFVTSGGFVFITPSNAMANFGAHGGCKNGAFWGHVNYVDHGSGYHVDSTQITGYLTSDIFSLSNIRDICGEARTNATEPQPVLFRVRLIDNGDPTKDEFGINLSNGYLVPTSPLGGGGSGGGTVELHGPNQSTTGPTPPPTEDAMCAGLAAP